MRRFLRQAESFPRAQGPHPDLAESLRLFGVVHTDGTIPRPKTLDWAGAVKRGAVDPLAGFLQWSALNNATPDRDSLDQYAESSGSLSPQEYDDIVNLINYNQGLQ